MSLHISKYTSHLVLSLFYLSQEAETVLYLLPEYLITIFYFEVSVVLLFLLLLLPCLLSSPWPTQLPCSIFASQLAL